MNYVKAIRSLAVWRTAHVHCRVLSGGATNVKYLVEVSGKRYVARFLGKAQARYLGLERKREIPNTNLAHKLGLGPAVREHAPKHALLVVQYLEGVIMNKRKLRQLHNRTAAAKLLRKLHAGGGFRGRFVIRSSIQRLQQQASRAGQKLTLSVRDQAKLADCLKLAGNRGVPYVRCHVDPMPQNFVRQGAKMKLIDWEYSAMGDPLFDLAFTSAVGRFDAVTDQAFLRAYGAPCTPKFEREFRAMRVLVYYREALWALNQIGRAALAFNYQAYSRKNLRWFHEAI